MSPTDILLESGANEPEDESMVCHVLHVDDSSSIRGMVSHMLGKEGRFTLKMH